MDVRSSCSRSEYSAAAYNFSRLAPISLHSTHLQICYRVQPSRSLARPLLARLESSRHAGQMQQAYTAAMSHAANTVRKMSWLRNNSSVDAARLTTSLAESLCARAAAKPATFVFKLWAAYQIMKVGKHQLGHQRTKSRPKR